MSQELLPCPLHNVAPAYRRFLREYYCPACEAEQRSQEAAVRESLARDQWNRHVRNPHGGWWT